MAVANTAISHTDTNPVGTNTTALTDDKALKMWILEQAKKKIVKCMFRTEAVPMNNVRLHYIKNAICKATQAGTDNPGNVNVQYICINSIEIFISFLQLVLSLKIEGDVNNMMTAVRQLFKQYAFCHVQQEYHLQPQIFSAASEVEHK